MLVFVRTKLGVDDLTAALKHNYRIRALAIHGDKTQTARERTLQAFDKGDLHVLVCLAKRKSKHQNCSNYWISIYFKDAFFQELSSNVSLWVRKKMYFISTINFLRWFQTQLHDFRHLSIWLAMLWKQIQNIPQKQNPWQLIVGHRSFESEGICQVKEQHVFFGNGKGNGFLRF